MLVGGQDADMDTPTTTSAVIRPKRLVAKWGGGGGGGPGAGPGRRTDSAPYSAPIPVVGIIRKPVGYPVPVEVPPPVPYSPPVAPYSPPSYAG